MATEGFTGAPGSDFFTTVVQCGSRPNRKAKCSRLSRRTELGSVGKCANIMCALGVPLREESMSVRFLGSAVLDSPAPEKQSEASVNVTAPEET